MTSTPEPLTPPDCDLRGMEWMPLYGGRLFMSDFEARASDQVFRAAMRLWWMAWQQVPAASLPDDDAVLCKLAGLGRDIKGWKRLRAADALHGFVVCSDGRLYHKLLAEEAREAWDRRVKERERKAAYRAKYSNGHGGNNTGHDEDVPRDKTRTELVTVPGLAADGDGDCHVDRTRQDRTGQDRTGTGQEERKKGSELRSGAGAPLSPRDQLWSEGLVLLRGMTGQSDRAARTFLGKLVSLAHDDCAKVFNVLWEAGDARPIDPQAWLMAAMRPRSPPRNPFLDPSFDDVLPAIPALSGPSNVH